MASQNKKPVSRQPQKKQPLMVKKETRKVTLFDKIEDRLRENEKKIFWVLFIISAVVSLLLFNAKITVDGDDSVYIKRAFDFVHQGTYPSFQGALFPFLLSVLIYFFGINLLVLKFLSVIFAAAGFYFTYKAFRNRIPYMVLFSILAFIATNSYIHFYSSQTYTESFYMFLQAFTLLLIFKVIDLTKDGSFNVRLQWSQWLLAGLFMFLLSITKNVAIITVAVLAFYFIILKQYMGVVYSLASFLVFKIPYSIFVRFVFGPQPNSQLQQLQRKEFYNPSAGNEDFNGYITRFFENLNHYVSKHFFKVINFRSEDVVRDVTLLTLIIVICFVLVLILSYRKNRQMLLTGLYFLAVLCVTCVVLQVTWDQTRIVLVVVPLMLLFLLYGLNDLAVKKPFFRFCFILFAGLILVLNLKNTLVKIDKNLPVLRKNLQGDMYYGYTPDWVNFLKMSKWCSENLPPKSFVGSRKPSMSFIYGNGKTFYGIYKVESDNADSVLAFLKREHITHLIVASLRADPRHADPNSVISTVHKMVYVIYSKYPEKVKQVYQLGETEPAYLYEIRY
jgi:hypothetical protein